MDKLRNILDTIYNTEHGMLYFYLILGVIALIFVVLIIITIVKAKKEDKILQEVEKNNPALKSEPQEEVKEPVKVDLKEEPKEEIKEESKEEIKEETPLLTDTPVVLAEPKEENKELTNTQSIHISNDEIKARLAKLKNLKKEEPAPAEKEIPLEQSDTGLINIMSNAGINDDMELPAIKEAHNTEEIDTNKTI